MSYTVRDQGLSTVYKPEGVPEQAIVDIILIHGLQGHPYKTWACPKPKTTSGAPATQDRSEGGHIDLKRWQKVLPKRVRTRSPDHSTRENDLLTLALEAMDTNSDQPINPNNDPEDNQSASVFWPRDLLPKECPRARILVYGYDTRVTKYMTGATSKNTIYAHAKDFLFALSRARPPKRPLILVAHSLGGIVVKEMLSASASSSDIDTQDIVNSLAAVIFLGTPHRGSPDLAAMGEFARSLVSTLRMETTSTILDALGLKTTDLERAQESFSSLWQKHAFRVKTFQEGMGLTGVNLGVLGNKVVPDHSSLIGDHRERAETIHANHMNMCRFFGIDDPNYCRVSGEIRSGYQSVAQLSHIGHGHRALSPTPSRKRKREGSHTNSLGSAEDPILQQLWYPTIYSRHLDIEKPAEGTCHWLFEHSVYQDWLHGTNHTNGRGLLRLRGKPGTGKSILMKEALNRASQDRSKSRFHRIAFFFDASGEALDRSPVGMYRSLLYQLLPKLFRSSSSSSSNAYEERSFRRLMESLLPNRVPGEGTLKTLFERALARWKPGLLVFIDGIDACDLRDARQLIDFWTTMTNSARGADYDLRVCISSRHFPTITIADCRDIIVEEHNFQDLKKYTESRLHPGITAGEPPWTLLKDNILEKSAGVFLWLVLVLDEVIRQSDEGHGVAFLLKRVDILPVELEALYAATLSSVTGDSKRLTLRLFTWAVLAQGTLRLHEWHHILAFIREPEPSSLSAWRISDTFTSNDDQLEKQVRSISRGLVEVKRPIVGGVQGYDTDARSISMCPGAGSLDLNHGQSRVVQVIHESVRNFFLHHDGFSSLDPPPDWNGHIFIMETCLKYIWIRELDALVLARRVAELNDSPRDSGHGHGLQGSLPVTELLLDDVDEHGNSENPSRSLERGMPLDLNPENPETSGMRTGYRGTTIFGILREFDEPDIGIDISLWTAGVSEFEPDKMEVDDPAPRSPTPLSVASQTRVLEDHPALLSYVTSALFTHALLAQVSDANPLNLIVEMKSWQRWRALKEDIPHWTSLETYAGSLGIWDPHGDSHYHLDSMNSTTGPDFTSQPEKNASYERAGSVASFGSAGSHRSYTLPSSTGLNNPFTQNANSLFARMPAPDHEMADVCSNGNLKASSGLFASFEKDMSPSPGNDLADIYASLQKEPLSPPPEDMNPSDPGIVPREQEPRFDGDLYTPRWVRGHGNKREGWCGFCNPGRWLVLKNSAFWWDKGFTHGISAATGEPFEQPQRFRLMDGHADVSEGLCSSCNEWIAIITTKRKGNTWFRHAYKCHTNLKIEAARKRRKESSHKPGMGASA